MKVSIVIFCMLLGLLYGLALGAWLYQTTKLEPLLEEKAWCWTYSPPSRYPGEQRPLQLQCSEALWEK